MNDKEILRQVEVIVTNATLSLDDRIEKVFEIHESSKEPEVRLGCYKVLIQTITKENAIASHVSELLMLNVLMAETYINNEDYRQIEHISFEVREILRDNRIAWEVIDETIPRILDALEETVYYHETYRLLLIFLNKAFETNRLTTELKGRARHLLKLRILIDDVYSWHDHLFSKELQSAIASLFTPEELLKIIFNPTIGHLKRDPIEYSEQWEEIYYAVEEYLKERFANAPRQMGFCFKYWEAKREYLKENYNIDWRSPAQMNPRVRFD